MAVKECACVCMEYTVLYDPRGGTGCNFTAAFVCPPKNEPLQDNEHFKTAVPTTPTTRLSQHSDIGRGRE